MQALAEEQRKAGLLLDDGALVRLNVSAKVKEKESGLGDKESAKEKEKTKMVFAEEDEEEEMIKKRKVPLVKLDFSVAESSEKMKERLERIKESVPSDTDGLFKAKVRWDGLSDVRLFSLALSFVDLNWLSPSHHWHLLIQAIIDRKFEPLIKRLMVKYLGEMEEEDLIMFVLEHLKDHKGPTKLVEGLEPVRQATIGLTSTD